MEKVVFTGPATDLSGKPILRDNLVKACGRVPGLEVQKSVRRDTTLLVASRHDTVKAKAASSRGIPVMTYPQFIGTYLRGIAIESGGEANPYTDIIDLENFVSVHIGGEQLALLDQL